MLLYPEWTLKRFFYLKGRQVKSRATIGRIIYRALARILMDWLEGEACIYSYQPSFGGRDCHFICPSIVHLRTCYIYSCIYKASLSQGNALKPVYLSSQSIGRDCTSEPILPFDSLRKYSQGRSPIIEQTQEYIRLQFDTFTLCEYMIMSTSNLPCLKLP